MLGTKSRVEENNAVVGVPLVVQPIAVPLETRTIPVHNWHIPVAVRVAEDGRAGPPLSLPRESKAIARQFRILYLKYISPARRRDFYF